MSNAKKELYLKKLSWISREAAAVGFWVYLITKLFIFDVDTYVADSFPSVKPLLIFKLPISIGTFTLLWLTMGGNRFFGFASYVVSYPVILFLWRIPKVLLLNWTTTIIFAPAIYEFTRTFRTTILTYCFIFISAFLVLFSETKPILVACISVIFIFCINHLVQALKRVYQPNMFSTMTKLTKSFREQIQMDGNVLKTFKAEKKNDGKDDDYHNNLTTFYLFDSFFEYIADELNEIARSRKADIFLLASWFWAGMLTAASFSFIYFALFKIDPSSFSTQSPLGFWSFLGFSLDKLTTSSFSAAIPISTAAKLFCYAQSFCMLFIVVILFFTFLTAARERYLDDVKEFISELRLATKSARDCVCDHHKLAINDIEIIVYRKNAEVVKWFRKQRKLPELKQPPSDKETNTPA